MNEIAYKVLHLREMLQGRYHASMKHVTQIEQLIAQLRF